MPWEDRLRVSFGVARLLSFLVESPLGSLAIHDFKMSQFVLVNGELKLSDLDDIDDGLRSCSSTSDCALKVGTNETIFTPCREGVCVDYSEISNVVHSHTTFYALLLFDAPRGMEELVGRLLNHTKRATWTAREIFQHMEIILDYYKGGKYINGEDGYPFKNMSLQVYHDRDLPGTDDYWCPGSRQQAATCVLSVYDVKEATRICAREHQCHAFVVTSERTWTGRQLVYFKKGISVSPQHSTGNVLYVFPR
ncbi:extracellular tyrosine-protein kinase PKDCC-like [Diadema setosum]|uniref:extracellular tyrosine-protein kinase PKDCC-like n=1 Tax=Diadema setosum TaxID=31175 RepID=UPI003B3A3026